MPGKEPPIMATLTIAQALATTATGIIVADTPVNIAQALGNASLVARVAQFTLNANGASGAGAATLLAGLGTKFSTGGFRFVVRDSVAALTDPADAAGLGIATVIAIYDTAANLLAAAGTPLMRAAGSVLLSTSSSLTLANLITLEAEPAFSVLPGQSITLADSAANLLALTAAEQRPAIRAYTDTLDSTVSVAAAASLFALPQFSVGAGATLTISGTVAAMTNPVVTPALASFAAVARVVVNVADSLSNLIAAAGTISTLARTVPGLTSAMTDVETVTAARLTALPALPHFGVAPGNALILADTVANLLALAPSVAAIVTLTTLSQSGVANVAQLDLLVALPGFGQAGGPVLTVTDTLAHLAGLTAAEHQVAGAIIVRDTVANLIAAPGLPAGTTDVVALLDGNIYTVAQADALLALGGGLTLVPSGSAAALQIADTSDNLATSRLAILALEADGPVTVTATDSPTGGRTILTATEAAGLVTSTEGLSVTDTGSALSALASQIFGRGFQAITVTSGLFAGTEAQLLDPTLHFTTVSGFTSVLLSLPASAQLVGSAVASAAQLTAMSILPGFSVAPGASLTIEDTVSALIGGSDLASQFATAAQVTDSETVTAAGAAALAAIRDAVGAGNFSLGGNVVTISDDAANITAPVNAGGITLAAAITLSVPSIINASQALSLVALVSVFSPGGTGITISDTAANLSALAGSAATLNGWHAVVLLSADTILTVSAAQPLLAFAAFATGTHHLTIADSAANLLAPGSAAALGLAGTEQLSQAATITAADAVALAGLHGFSTGGQTLTIADTPVHLVALPVTVLALATAETIVARTTGNAADFTISAAQLAALQALPNLSVAGFANSITVSDTAPALAGLAPALAGASSGTLLSHVVPLLSADAIVTAATANTLAHLPNFGLAGHGLVVADAPAALLSPGVVAGLAIATGTGIAAPATVTVAGATALAALHNFATNGNALTIADTPANLLTLSNGVAALAANERIVPFSIANAADFTLTAGQLIALAAIPNLAFTGPLTIMDTAANLILLEALFAAATPRSALQAARGVSAAVLSADATVTAASLGALASLPGFSLGGHALSLIDTPTALLGAPPSALALATGVTLAGNASPWTVSAIAADTLASLPNFGTGPGLTVSDNVGNLLAPGNARGLTAATSVTIGENPTVSAAQAIALHNIAGFTIGAHHLTISNGAAGLATLDAGTAAMATAIQLAGGSVVTVSQLQALQALPNFNTNGNALVVSDTAVNLLTLVGGNTAPASVIVLQANATLTADLAEALATLPNFSTGAAHIAILDSVAHLLQVTGIDSLPDDWSGELAASTITLNGDATVSAAQATELLALGGRLVLGGHVLTVSDTAANLLSAANAAGLALAATITLAAPEANLAAATATALAGFAGFSKGGNSVTVSDSAANLAFAGNAAGLGLADHIQVNAVTALSAASAEALIGLTNFQVNVSAPVSIADSLNHLLHLATTALVNNNDVLLATPIGLSDDAVATVAQLAALSALPQYALAGHGFRLNGNDLVLMDSGRHLASYIPDGVLTPTSIVMAGDATLSAAQAGAIASLGIDLGGNTLTVADAPAALLDAANVAGLGLAGVLTLSGDATATAAQAVALFGNSRFNTGGHILTIQDTAAALLELSPAIDTLATTLALSGADTVDVAALIGLTELGIKFSLAGHALTVADTAAHLATLNGLETRLASAEVLNASASLNAATAETLAALPNFSVGGGVTVTIVDTVANLTALSGAAQAIATSEMLSPGSSATLTVAQALGLATLRGFTNAGSTITVTDTISHLSAPGWEAVATSFVVTDSVARLVAEAGSALLANAALVTLLGDSVIDTTAIDTLAGIAHFSRGTAALVVADAPDAIAAHAAEILAVASAARIVTSTPVTAAQAETLVGLANAGALTFSGSNHLVVADSFVNLANPANADGVALAATVTVTDTAANLVAAAAHDWGSVAPFYVLAGDDTVTGAQAAVLAGLGGHFTAGGHTLVMADTASGVTANAPALTALSINARVSDTVADVDAHAAGLLAIGAHLLSVTITDVGTVSAAVAAGLHALAALMTGHPIAVSDSSSAVVANATGLLALGGHLGTITVTDATPISAAVATGLLPLLADLAIGTTIDVSDTGVAVAAQALGLASLGSALGTVTPSDGTATNASTATALLPIQAHLGVGVALDVSDTAAAIAAAASGLATLAGDGRIASITAPHETVAHVIAHGATLASLGATAGITDTAANVNTALDGLEAIHAVVGTISLSDAGTPTLHVSITQLAADGNVLAAIVTPHDLSASDTAAHIQADLAGGTSRLLTDLGGLTSIVANDAGTVTLTAAQVLAAGVDDGPGSAMAKFSGGTLAVSGVVVADVSTVAGLTFGPTSMAVVDTAAHIQNDLASGSSQLVSERGLISHIAVAGGGAITLTESAAIAAHVDDGAGSVFAKLTGGGLVVTGVSVADIGTIAALPNAPTAIGVSDTAANVQADLAGGGSHILAHLAKVSGITVSDAGTITLTVNQIEAAGVDGGAGSALAKMTGETLVVAGAVIADIHTLAGLGVAPSSIAVSDTAAHIQADLAAGGLSEILTHLGSISSVTASDAGTISLTESQILLAGVDDGAGSALSRITGETLTVTGVAVANVGSVLGLGVAPSSISVSDTAAHIQADLASGASTLVAHLASITGITASDAGTITLSTAQVVEAGVDDGPGSVLDMLSGGTLVVSGAAVADIVTLAALDVLPSAISVSDSVADVVADLSSGASSILSNIGLIGAIALTDAGTPSLALAIADLIADSAAIDLITTPYTIGINDTAANIQADLTSGAPLVLAHLAAISGITVDGGGTITLTQTQVLAAHVDDGAGSVFSKLSGGDLEVTDVTVAEIDPVLALPFAPASIAVSDTAANLQADLVSSGSVILAELGWMTSITVSDAGTISLTDSQVQVAGVDDGVGSFMRLLTSGTVVVTGVPVADIATILGLDMPPHSIAVVDTAADITADLTGGSSALIANVAAISGITVSDAGTISLTVAQAEAAAVDDGAGSVFSKISGVSFTVAGATVADIDALAALSVPPAGIAISDTAAHIQADLASGSSHVLAHLGLIAGITVSDAGTITLTETQLRAAHVDDGPASVLALTSGGALAVTHVLAADIRTVGGLFVVPSSFAITDSAAHLQADLTSGSSALLSYLGSITAITVSPAGTITLTESQVLGASVDDFGGSALAKMSGLTLAVTDVPAADIGTILALGVSPASIVVVDTAAGIQADLTSGSSSILAHRGAISGITVSDAGTISLTVAQAEAAHVDDGAGSVFAKLSGGTLAVTGAAVADIGTLASLGVAPTAIAVSDTAAHIQADLASGSSDILAHTGLIDSIAVSDAGTITLTENQLRAAHVDDGAGSVFARISGGTLAVTHVLAADIGIVAGLGVAPGDIAVSDTAAHLQADLTSGSSHILASLGLISGITVNPAGTISLTETQVRHVGVDDGSGSALAKMTGLALAVTGVLSADIGTIAALGVAPASIGVVDTAAHIQADLIAGSSNILVNLDVISGITASPAGTITLTEAQILAAGVDDGAGSALSLLSGATVNVTGVAIADIATILGLGVVPSRITVLDSAANVVADLTGGSSVIVANSAAIASVVPTDASLAVADATALYDALLGVAALDETGLTITGSSSDLLAAFISVPALLAAAASVTMDDNPTGLTAAEATTLSGILGGHLGGGQTLSIVDTASHLLLAGNAAGIALATDVALDTGILSSAGVVTALAGLHAFNAAAQTIWIQDTVAHLLNSANAAGLAIASRVMPQADSTVTAAELTSLAAIGNFETGGHAITVQDTAADIAALSQPALGFASLAAVTDTAAHVAASLGTLQSVVTAHGHALSITLSDGTPGTIAIIVTAATYAADTATLDAITINGVMRVTGGAAELAALATTLHNDTVVGEVAVSDTAANVLSNLTALVSIGAKFDSATISDTALNAALISGLLTVPHLHAGSVMIADTGAQIASAIQANGAPGLAFLNAHTVQLSVDSVVTASQALSLESLSALQKNGHTLSAWDTAPHLIDSIDGYLAAVSSAQIDGVYLKTSGGTATVSASTAAALFGIPLFSKNNPNGTSNVLTVQDTAAHIESAFAALNTHAGAIDHVVVSASTTVTDAVFGDLLTLGATAALGVAVTVRDTAANIIGHAPAQLAGSPSLTPTTWALSGSATVTVAGAAFLGGLSGFSAGASTLTIGADASASVADANHLGSLGATLHLGGHHVHVAGSVAAVSALTGAAKAIVTPDITDTFAHVATLTLGSGLLGGTITVTDSEAPTVAQANAFLALLLAGGNGGIPAANVSFGGHTEAVTDTLANIQSLTGSAGWTSNASVHGDFTLVVADTVAHLIDPANTAALAAMAGTTLSGDQTVSAANAESLVNLETTIHFGLGGHTVTIQDTAAHLLDAANADGEALASAWQLSGNDTVAAVDAETLLTEAKFHLNHTLTVSDSSDSLLDGVLSGVISGSAYAASVHVALAGPETLDAQTAAALVALPGFTNNGDLSIQDSSDYLLNPANHAAEAASASVTLVGDETVSAATAERLAGVPNFTLGSNHLTLASDDYADAPTLAAIANFDTGFDAGGHTLTMTQDALSLTPTEYAALQSDNIVLNGHALSALASGVSVTSAGGTVEVSGAGVDGATLNVYASDGTSLSQTAGVTASFTASASEGSIGNGVVVTETVGASAAISESAPIIALERTILTDAATADGATFAGSGQVQVDAGAYVNIYTTATAPGSPANPALVYDAAAHTLSLDVGGHAPLVLVTLGGATVPAALDPSEIFVRHFV
jgi:hypothetical protein